MPLKDQLFYIFSVTLAKYTSIENVEASKEEAKKSKKKKKLASHIGLLLYSTTTQ